MFKSKKFAYGLLAATLALSFSACNKDEVGPRDLSAEFKHNRYTSMNGTLGFDGSSAADLCQTHAARLKLIGDVRISRGGSDYGDYTFSNKPGRDILTACGDWTFQVRLEKLQITMDKDGNPITQWVPQVNNNSVGFIDDACNISVNAAVAINQQGNRLHILTEAAPNGSPNANDFYVRMPDMTIQCQ